MGWIKAPSSNGAVDNTALTPRVNGIESNVSATQTKIKDIVEPKIDGVIANLSKANRKTVTLAEGTSIVTSDVNTLADIEIQGRTLTSMANSNLVGDKHYVLADKKTKLVVNKTTVAGVGKFKKAPTLKTTADFKDKIAGSTVENPHIFTHLHNGDLSMATPESSRTYEHTIGYSGVTSIDGRSTVTGNTINPTSTGAGTQFFYFNLLEQIERTIGIIPKELKKDKIQWMCDNIESLTLNWVGYGVSTGGYKATIQRWVGGSWAAPVSHTISTNSAIKYQVTRVAGVERPTAFIKSTNDGFVQFAVHSDPSTGNDGSYIYTEYIDLEIELKSTAQLMTRPSIIRVENFEGKVAGSVVENPHMLKYGGTNTINTLSPSSGSEAASGYYKLVESKDGTPFRVNPVTVGVSSFQKFSFNIIAMVERNIGKIPGATIGDKVSWISDNVSKHLFSWYGYGTGPNGSKIILNLWNNDTSSWINGGWSHDKSEISLLQASGGSSIRSRIDSDGFLHFVLTAEPATSTVASITHTDFCELSIELKPDADFHAPKVPLYEVTKEEYDKVLVAWDESEVLRRYPVVEGIQHLTNPYIVAEGENLLPPFTDKAWSLHSNTKINGAYEIVNTANLNNELNEITLPVLPNRDYYFGVELSSSSSQVHSLHYDSNMVSLNNTSYGMANSVHTTPSNAAFVRFRLTNANQGAGTFSFKNVIFTLGSTPKPFVPRNPSYLYAQAKLGAVGNVSDVLFKQEGKWKVRKSVESSKSDTEWHTPATRAGAYQLKATLPNSIKNSMILQGYRGEDIKLFRIYGDFTLETIGLYYDSSDVIHFMLPNSDSGWTSTPTENDIKRYFNGWKYTNGTTWTSVTGNGQTATAQIALDTKPTDYTPYKLSYTLQTPVIEDAYVEGEIKVNGMTQMEVGSGIVVREKIAPSISTTNAHINSFGHSSVPNSPLKFQAHRIVRVYKNGIDETHKWLLGIPLSSYGSERASLPIESYDPKAEYTVTYLVLDKNKFTNSPTNTKLSYTDNIRGSLDTLVNSSEDLATNISVNGRLIMEVLARLKAQGL